MNRGLTLIETLLALSLLALITGAIASWTNIARYASTTSMEKIRTDRAVNTVFQLIQDDLVSGDFAEPRPTAGSGPTQLDQVTMRDGVLQIFTRVPGAGSVIRRYLFDNSKHSLSVRDHRSSEPANASRELVVGIQAFEAAIDHKRHELTVRMQIDSQDVIARTYLIQ